MHKLEQQSSFDTHFPPLPYLTVVPAWAAGLQVVLFGPHAVPAWQHIVDVPLPHRVVPAGQPQTPDARSMHPTPPAQQAGPQGVVPEGQQQLVARSEQVPPQHLVPQRASPAGQVA
jgi:hypothetical protein